MNLSSLCHPNYTASYDELNKFRLTLTGGQPFIESYLVKFSNQESDTDFINRKSLTYNPAFAKSALIDIRNSIFQRMVDVSRDNGSESYQKAVNGEGKGVDLSGSSMNYFLGQKVLLELMGMSRVGILVDRAPLTSNTSLINKQNYPPYMYTYKTEDILDWHYDKHGVLDALLLRDCRGIKHQEYIFTETVEESFRYLERRPNGIYYKIENSAGTILEESILNIPDIPFVICEIENSLLRDVSDYQIAMLNLSSSDLNYALKSNFPFLVENMMPSQRGNNTKDNTKIVNVGHTQGRGYLQGLNAPAFINPSADPLKASMDKQEQMKTEIKQLVNTALLELGDGRGLESGLSYIGLELERSEKQLAKIWSSYEKDKNTATVKYPNNYTIKSDKERFDETSQLADIRKTVPSLTYRKEITKQMVDTTLAGKVSVDVLAQIKKEIDEAPVIVTDPDKIIDDHKEGLVSDNTASLAAGYPVGESDRAFKDRTKRIEHTLLTQMKYGRKGIDNMAEQNLGARGADNSNEGKEEAKFEKKVDKETEDVE